MELLINLITVGQENAIISAPSSAKKQIIKAGETKWYDLARCREY